MTQDPDSGWFNLGAYRSQVYDAKTVGCQITEGKHGRIHRDKYFERGQPMKVGLLGGQEPWLFVLSSSALPEVTQIDIAGGPRGGTGHALHRDPDPPALSRPCPPGAAYRRLLPGRRLCRQMDGGGR